MTAAGTVALSSGRSLVTVTALVVARVAGEVWVELAGRAVVGHRDLVGPP
jgi:hypothetical protein